MSATVEDVNAKLDSAVSNLKKTTSSYFSMVKKYGSDWTEWLHIPLEFLMIL